MKEINGIKLKSLVELRDIELTELKKEVVAVKKSYFELKMKNELNELKQTHLVKVLRRYIAAMNTVINSKNI